MKLGEELRRVKIAWNRADSRHGAMEALAVEADRLAAENERLRGALQVIASCGYEVDVDCDVVAVAEAALCFAAEPAGPAPSMDAPSPETGTAAVPTDERCHCKYCDEKDLQNLSRAQVSRPHPISGDSAEGGER